MCPRHLAYICIVSLSLSQGLEDIDAQTVGKFETINRADIKVLRKINGNNGDREIDFTSIKNKNLTSMLEKSKKCPSRQCFVMRFNKYICSLKNYSRCEIPTK